jgi:uncharacterized protein
LSQEDVELVRALYDAFDSKDLGGVVSLMGDDMVATVLPGVPWSGVYHGPEGFRSFLETIADYVELSIETDSLVDTGGEIRQEGRTTGYTHVSGILFSFEEVHIWRVKDGKIVAFSNHSDIEEQRRVLAADLEISL